MNPDIDTDADTLTDQEAEELDRFYDRLCDDTRRTLIDRECHPDYVIRVLLMVAVNVEIVTRLNKPPLDQLNDLVELLQDTLQSAFINEKH